ncbi:MAG TPA: hypothetical protein PLW86_19995 [Rhodocyclaceae bacterium]|nr:hypothetical protein [Rhodocyclaceae bacterium]
MLSFANPTLPEFSDDLLIAPAVGALQGPHGKPNTFSSYTTRRDTATKGITEQWQRFQSMLLPNVTNASMNQHALAAIAQGERLLRYVDTTVKLYERLAK